MYGRRRLVPELNSRDFQRRAASEREAVNMPIQGSAADIMKRAMIDVHAALAPHPDARMILTVHDELLFEVPKARAEEFAEIVRDRMQSAAALNVPLTVDVGIGENWKDAKQLNRYRFHLLLELLPLLTQALRRLRGGLRAVGDDRAQHQAVEIGAQRRRPRSVVSGARTQPASAASHAACRSPCARAAAASQYAAAPLPGRVASSSSIRARIR